MPDSFRVDASGLDDLARKLRRAAVEARLEVDKSLMEIGEAHKQKALEALDGHSTSIPPTIRVDAIPGGVRVSAAGTALAWSYEKGNKSGVGVHGDKDWFSHPVFGRKDVDWVEQARYPFLRTARAQLRKWSLATVTRGMKRGLTRSGVKVEEI